MHGILSLGLWHTTLLDLQMSLLLLEQAVVFVNARAPRTPIYSDRFIPSRATSSRLEGYSLLDRAEVAQDTSNLSEREEASGAYTQLLRSELLGLPSQCCTPDRNGSSSNGFVSPTSR